MKRYKWELNRIIEELPTFGDKLQLLQLLAQDISDHWQEELIVNYPQGLPSFDELAATLSEIEVRGYVDDQLGDMLGYERRVIVTEQNIERVRKLIPADQGDELIPGCVTWSTLYTPGQQLRYGLGRCGQITLWPETDQMLRDHPDRNSGERPKAMICHGGNSIVGTWVLPDWWTEFAVWHQAKPVIFDGDNQYDEDGLAF